jgi:hypothetical protein
VKSRPFKSPWGIHKTRMALQSQRLDRFLKVAIKRGVRSPMPMRFFDAKLARFHQNWSK